MSARRDQDRVVRRGQPLSGDGALSIRREKLDRLVLVAIEAKLLARDRLRTLLAGVRYVSQSRQAEREADLTRSRSERTRLNTAISNLLILIEEGMTSVQDPAFA